MDALTPQQRRALRAKAHHLHPVVSIGQQGLTPMVLNEIDLALTAHGLIKIRVHSDDRDEREALLADIVEHMHAAPVQHLGKLLIVWRERDEEEAAPEPATKPARNAHTTTGRPRQQAREPRTAGETARPATERRRRGKLRTAPMGTFIGEAPREAANGVRRAAKPAAKRAPKPAATRVPKAAAKPHGKPASSRRRRG